MKRNFIWTSVLLIAAIALGCLVVIIVQPSPFFSVRKDRAVPSNSPLQTPAKESPPKVLAIKDFFIGDIGLGMSSHEVENILGMPDKTSVVSEPSIHNPDYTTYYETWSYPGLDVTFLTPALNDEPQPQPDRVFAIVATSPRFTTPRGLRVNDSVKELFSAYQKTSLTEGAYSYEKELSVLSFVVKTGIIQEIEVHQTLD